MEQDTIRQKIRERLAAGALPREIPPLTGGPGQPLAPRAHIMADSAIGLARCSGCDADGARVTYRYADGTILRFHGRCHRIWEEECPSEAGVIRRGRWPRRRPSSLGAGADRTRARSPLVVNPNEDRRNAAHGGGPEPCARVGGLAPRRTAERRRASMATRDVVRAAGGVVSRQNERGELEVLLIHRPHRRDWTFPKGKVDAGETDEACALREVEEETALRCVLGTGPARPTPTTRGG